MIDPTDQARRYLTKVSPAVSGQGGHDQAFQAACVLVQGFGLSVDQARPIFTEYSARCTPPWSEREANHKLDTAAAQPGHMTKEGMKPRGHMLRQGVRYQFKSPVVTPAQVPTVAPARQASKSRRYELERSALPEPVADGTRALLRAAFLPGEGIRIAPGRYNEEGHEIPKDGGIVLTLEEWLARLDKSNGDPNKFMRTSERNGIFIAINPTKGASDSDVTAYRHALIESDSMTPEEQWSLIQQSRIPCTAVLLSGGKSVHAWVRVDAKDKAEFQARVKILHEHFDQHQRPDPKNVNPNRFSRLANCERGNKRQELLSLACGAESFSAWAAELETDGVGHVVSIDALLAFKPEDDTGSRIGHRWLCRGGSALIVGPSGVGKSSLSMQMMICWAIGRPFFGICARERLTSLVIQAENDDGDLAEMMQGVVKGMALTADDVAEIKRRVIIIRDVIHVGQAFTEAARRLIDRHKSDLVWFDPLLSFIGDDISKQVVCSQFLRGWLGPISEATGVVWMMVHHTNKPPQDSKAKKGWTSTDYSYPGTGSSELTNWARAVCVLQRVTEDAFELKLAKRGKRAGAKSIQGAPTSSLWLKHSDTGIVWEQIEEPAKDQPKKEKTEGKRGRPKAAFDYDGFIADIRGEFFSKTKLIERAVKFSGMSKSLVWNEHADAICERLSWDEKDEVYCVPK